MAVGATLSSSDLTGKEFARSGRLSFPQARKAPLKHKTLLTSSTAIYLMLAVLLSAALPAVSPTAPVIAQGTSLSDDITGDGVVDGRDALRQTRSVTGAGDVAFLAAGGYGGVTLNANGLDLGSTEVRIKGNQDCTAVPGETVKRCFDITPTNATGRNATITFSFAGSEIPAGQSCGSMNGYRWDGSTWQLLTLGARACGAEPYSVRVTGVSAFSPFVIKETSPTTVALCNFAAQPATAWSAALAILLMLSGGLALGRRQAQT